MPEQDLVLLSLKIAKDPQTYKEEYLEQLKTLETFLSLPEPPLKQIQPMIFFIVRHSSIEPIRSVKILVESLEIIKEYKTRRVVLDGLIIMRQKGYIETKELIRLIIIHGQDLSYFVKSSQEFVNSECYPILKEWYLKGTERQKCYCYFLLLVLFSIVHGLEKNNDEDSDEDEANSEDVSCIDDNESDISYIDDNENESNINSTDINSINIKSNRSNRNIIKLSEETLNEFESLICDAFFTEGRLSKTACLYFLNRTEVKFDISKFKNGEKCGVKIFKSLSEEIMDRDLKIMKIKIFVIFKKAFLIKKSILKIVMDMIDLEREDLKELLECLVESVDLSESVKAVEMIANCFMIEGQTEELIVLGMNVIREIYSKLYLSNCSEDDSDCDESDIDNDSVNIDNGNIKNILEKLKDKILKSIACFKGNKTKSIFYAYKNVLKVVIENEIIEKPVSHIKQKNDKEKREIIRKKGKEEIKRLKEMKKREEKQEKYKKKKRGRSKNVVLFTKKRKNKK